jgi:hypothetical protein
MQNQPNTTPETKEQKQEREAQEALAALLAPITELAVKQALTESATDMELVGKESCSAQDYGLLIFLSLTKLGISGRPPAEFLPLAATAWEYIPKNPSAMRQAINKTEQSGGNSAKVSAMLAKIKGLKS